eukprot:TRINITY_DN2439_c0_g1_i1.p1 TRINITY_DN2439_c0_g1~~TRINITY_DN2439_c0_g1_i1.p1  ORF type:complete len:552 (+),score=137.51 TRINITY_DN2439_c0_g1_i1:904-2559(+)
MSCWRKRISSLQSSKMAQMILYLCRDTNLKVMSILNGLPKKEDVTEFITTVQLVQITINQLLKSNKEFSFEALKEMQTSLKEYESTLGSVNEQSKLLRILNSNRLRRKIETANSNLHQKLEIFRSSIKEPAGAASANPVSPTPANRTISHTLSSVDLNSSSPNSPSHTLNRTLSSSPSSSSLLKEGLKDSNTEEESVEQEAESRMRLAAMIEDQDVKDLWAELFGLEAFMISWDVFMNGLRKVLTEVKSDEEIVLRYVLDNSGTGFINQHRFAEFLKGFGPVQDCLKNVRSILSSRWFCGFLTRGETELVLRDQPAGTFLIRFSSSAPGSFALAFVQDNQKNFFHILINSVKPLGFQVQEQQNQNARTFPSLHELIDFYSVFLQVPFVSDLPFESWFEGDMNSVETTEALTGHEPGTFLVRFSSQIGSYAVSFVGADNRISHSLVEHENVPGGNYRIMNERQPLLFNDLKEVVHYYGDALKFPLKNTTNSKAAEATRQIIRWKQERGKQMEAVDQIVQELFNVDRRTVAPQIKGPLDPQVEAIVSRLFNVV